MRHRGNIDELIKFGAENTVETVDYKLVRSLELEVYRQFCEVDVMKRIRIDQLDSSSVV